MSYMSSIYYLAILAQTTVGSVYTLLQDGGVLAGALLVIYGQHKFYRYMIDKLEEKHLTQVAYLEAQLKVVNDAFYDKSKNDNDLIRRLTENIKNQGS